MKELAEACRANEVTDLIIFHEHRGTPGEPSPILVIIPLPTTRSQTP